MELILKLWLYLAFGLAGFMCCYVWQNKQTFSRNKILSIFMVITLPFHMFEERIWPGGFSYIYDLMSGLNQTQLVMLSCNVTALLVLLILWIKKGDKAWYVLSMAMFGIAEFVLHVAEAVVSYQHFANAGMVIPYSPGFLVTIVFFLPGAIISIRHLLKTKQITKRVFLTALAVMAVIAVTTIALPNFIFSGSAYPFPDAGFYEQFIS